MNNTEKQNAIYRLGDIVIIKTEDYIFEGKVVSVFWRTSGKVRYVVENDDNILEIFSEKQMELLMGDKIYSIKRDFYTDKA